MSGYVIRVWGAHAPRVLAMAPRQRKLFLSSNIDIEKKIAARAPQSAREARALPNPET